MAEVSLTSVDQEVAELKAHYDRQCRVMKNVGDYMYMLDVKVLKGSPFTLKIHVTAEYPETCPDLLVRCDIMEDGQRGELQGRLEKIAESAKGKPMLLRLASETLSWLENQNLCEVLLETSPICEKGGKTSKQKKSKNKKKKKATDVVEEKLPSMKTAEDVISRIFWDENLPADCFIVGYLDRFIGIQEQPITAFSWEDLSAVDNTVLAIPKHRIQYFKYKTQIVWDKNKRLDLMFGSTGNDQTISDVIRDYVEPVYEAVQDRSNNLIDSDDDDDIKINVGYSGESNNHHNVNDALRPNHFLCVRVLDPTIVEGVTMVQDSMLEQEERYAPCVIPPTSLHVTLCTLGLDTPDQIANARRILTETRNELQQIVKTDTTDSSNSTGSPSTDTDVCNFTVSNVDHFYDRVVYAGVQPDQRFYKLVNHLRILMTTGGVDVRDAHTFVPHLTLMKTSRPVSRQMSTQRINRALWEGFDKMHFGTQTVDGIYLCEMSDRRGDDGFYFTPAQIKF